MEDILVVDQAVFPAMVELLANPDHVCLKDALPSIDLSTVCPKAQEVPKTLSRIQ